MSRKVSSNESSNRLKKLLDYAWLNLGDISELQLVNPMADWTVEESEDPVRAVLRRMRRPEYFAWTCKKIFNIDLLPFQVAILWELWVRPFPMLIATRGAGKSFILALYSMLRSFLCPGIKIVVAGAAFRQSKILFEYCETIWNNAPILRDLCGAQGRSGPRRDIDRCTMIIGESVSTFIPIGDGSKVRGLRANDIICDEFSAQNRDIFETVISGFAVVSANPVEEVKRAARAKVLREAGYSTEAMGLEERGTNKIIISGTAYYDFNFFADYWKKWKAIVESKGDPHKLAEWFGGEDNIPPGFNWKDFSVIRLPVELLPDGYLDPKIIARSKASVHAGVFQNEYGAVFSADSAGFFSRKLIEMCVSGNPNRPIDLPGYTDISFTAALRGNHSLKYVLAVDPASEHDNCSFVIVECHDNHRRIVYCWTITRSRHQERVKAKMVDETDYYAYCARKIRELMTVFSIERIAMDSQGGGIPIAEALHDKDKIKVGELPIWPIIEDKEKPTDDFPGLHILEMVNFAKADWVAEANHGMRKDFEDKVLLFPHFDGLSLAMSLEDDKRAGRVKIEGGKEIKLYDTLEDCVIEIEQLKDELATIVHTQTPNSGRDRWDTPEVKMAGNKKGRLRKDRYSALLMANMTARSIMRTEPAPIYKPVGGFANKLVADRANTNGRLYVMGPEWSQQAAAGAYGAVVRR